MSSTSTKEPNIRREYPYRIKKFSEVSISVDENVKLSGTIWMPVNEQTKNSFEEKFGCILEYLPYRKSDWTSCRDELRLKYLCGFGYVSIRVDIRGTGNSQGLFDDEYSQQELNDGLTILQWIENQTWSNGKIVIFGKSWGGFNALQLAYLQPKSLCGIISAYSTDDRYSDDIHYLGGAISAQEALNWSSQMFLWLSIPPHCEYQGGIDQNEDLIEIWKERLNNQIPLDYYWIKHQNRDDYWRHGSVCEDYSRITCPVLLIGGFADLYSDPVFRLINQLKCSKRAIVGPWGHQWPDSGYPGPQIGFLQEIVQWLDYHLKGISNDYQKKSLMTIYQFYPSSDELHSIVEERKGRWINTNDIPSYPSTHYQRNNQIINQEKDDNHSNQMKFFLSFQRLTFEENLDQIGLNKISFVSPEETGITSGNLLGWGNRFSSDQPIDQREDDGRSISFDSLPLTKDYDFFGFPHVKLNISSNNGKGLICVRLCMIDSERNSSILISRGVLNLSHHQSHEYPQPLNIDQIYNIDLTLSAVCVRLPEGSRLRLAVSSSYWPIVWPSSERSILTIHFNDPSSSFLTIPYLINYYCLKNDFDPPEVAEGIPIKELRSPSTTRQRKTDQINEIFHLQIDEDSGCIEYPDGLMFDERCQSEYEIQSTDPQSAKVQIERNLKYYPKDSSLFQVHLQTKSQMFADQSNFQIIHQLNIKNKDQPFFNKNYHFTFPRLSN